MDFASIETVLNFETFDAFETSSSSSDESNDDISEIMDMTKTVRQKCRDTLRNDYSDLSDEQFEMRFRLPRDLVDKLVEKIRSNIEFPEYRNNPIPPKLQVLIALRYYASGTFQSVLGDLFGVSQKSVSRIIENVSHAIASLAAQEVKFPETRQEMRTVNHEFFKISNMPLVIGVIDGTHIPIENPGGENSELFRNRKGFFSINTQVVVDATMKIVDIVARWPGSNHDQSIFNFSKLKIRCEDGEFGDCVILGDAAYSCKNYLLTPLANAITSAEKKYQKAFVQTRLIVERTIGVWKRRFPVVGSKMRCDLNTSVVVIVATSVLHNWLRDRPVPPVDESIPPPYPEPDVEGATGSSDFARRNEFIDNFFQQ